MEEIYAMEIIKAVSGKEEELKRELQAIILACQSEEEYLQYDLFESIKRSSEFCVLMW